MEWVKRSIYPTDEKQTAIGMAQTCMSSLGIGLQLVAHQVPFFLFLCKWERGEGQDEQKRDRHLYFIGQDALMPS